ncbi:MAG: 3-deoxy-D-manno-octulosonic acid transferase [Pirellulales bacterium]
MGLLLDSAYASALAVSSPYLLWRSIRTGRYRSGWSERLAGRVPELDRDRQSIWLHGVSLGEVQLLVPIVEQLNVRYPQFEVVLSTSTMTGMEVACKRLPDTKVFTFPWDFSWAMQTAVRRLRPALIVLGELEVWPHLVATAHRDHVPVAVVNGRLSDRSFRGYQRFRRLLKPTFSKLSLVAAQNEETAFRFVQLGTSSERVSAVGSLKFDNVNADRFAPEVERLRKLVGLEDPHRVLIAGSTQSPEEVTAARAWMAVHRDHGNSKLIVVPRHPERFDAVYNELQELGLNVVRRSQLNEPIACRDWDVLLVDTVGELRWWWGLADCALVGGSFGTRGGQNMLEPAAYGASVAFGPNTSNFRDIVRPLKKADAVVELAQLSDIETWFRSQLESPADGRARGLRAKQFIATQQGATRRTLEALDELLRRSLPHRMSHAA